MTTPVNIEIAKLLKEKGFDEECRLCVEDGDERPLPFNCGNTIHRNSLHSYYSAPTIAEVVMWLYKKHGIWINPIPRLSSWIFTIQEVRTSNNESLIGIDFYESNTYLKSKGVPTIMNSPTEAYLGAIEYTLNNLI